MRALNHESKLNCNSKRAYFWNINLSVLIIYEVLFTTSLRSQSSRKTIIIIFLLPNFIRKIVAADLHLKKADYDEFLSNSYCVYFGKL